MTEQSRAASNLREQARRMAERALGAGPAADDLAEQIVALAEQVPQTPYAAALDETYLLRGLCAHEALALAADLGYASFPKSRRQGAQERVERLKAAARGNAQQVTASLNLKPVLRLVDAPETLTRGSFEASLPQR